MKKKKPPAAAAATTEVTFKAAAALGVGASAGEASAAVGPETGVVDSVAGAGGEERSASGALAVEGVGEEVVGAEAAGVEASGVEAEASGEEALGVEAAAGDEALGEDALGEAAGVALLSLGEAAAAGDEAEALGDGDADGEVLGASAEAVLTMATKTSARTTN
ncbi:unnamed protein product [Camellia sinensis]